MTDEQELFLSTTRRFLDAKSPPHRARELATDPVGVDLATWALGAELGWFSLLVPVEDGGGSVSGEGVVDLALLAAVFGRVLFPGPFLPTNIVAFAIAQRGSAAQRDEYLKSIACGETIGTWAFAEANDRWDAEGVGLQATPAGPDFRLSGTKAMVQDAHTADLLLVTARTPAGLTQFLVPTTTPGVRLEVLEGLDLTRRFAEVGFDDVTLDASAVLGPVDGAAADAERLLDLAAVLHCGESLGAAERLFEMTLEYARQRRAFGRAIGSFQAIKHSLADIAGALEGVRAVTAAAAVAVQRDIRAAELTSVAKSYTGQQTPRIARACLQIHGGIGFTWEHDVHLYLRRIESNRVLFGDPDHHLDRLATFLGL